MFRRLQFTFTEATTFISCADQKLSALQIIHLCLYLHWQTFLRWWFLCWPIEIWRLCYSTHLSSSCNSLPYEMLLKYQQTILHSFQFFCQLSYQWLLQIPYKDIFSSLGCRQSLLIVFCMMASCAGFGVLSVFLVNFNVSPAFHIYVIEISIWYLD